MLCALCVKSSKASPRVNLTLLHCHWRHRNVHITFLVWFYRLSADCSGAFAPLGTRSEQPAPWAVPFRRPRRSVKGYYSGMLFDRYLCPAHVSHPLLFAFSSSLPLLLLSNPRMPIKKKEEKKKEKETQCWEPCEVIGESIGAAPHPLQIPQLST